MTTTGKAGNKIFSWTYETTKLTFFSHMILGDPLNMYFFTNLSVGMSRNTFFVSLQVLSEYIDLIKHHSYFGKLTSI